MVLRVNRVSKDNSDNKICFWYCGAAARQVAESEEQREDRLQTGLLVGILLAMVLMVAAVLVTVYMYHHPTSSASLFFIEVASLKHCITHYSKWLVCLS